jgi:hypothetical protein
MASSSCPVVGERALVSPSPRAGTYATRDASTQCGQTTAEAAAGEVDGIDRLITEAEERSERFLRRLGCTTLSIAELRGSDENLHSAAQMPRRAHPLVPVFGSLNWPGSGPPQPPTGQPTTPSSHSVGSLVYIHSPPPSLISVRTLPSMNFSDSPSYSLQSTPRDIHSQLEVCGARPFTPPFRRPTSHMNSILQLLGGPSSRSVMVHHTMGAAAVSFLFEKLLTACTQRLFPDAMAPTPCLTTPSLRNSASFPTPPQSPSPNQRGDRAARDDTQCSQFSSFQVINMDTLQ